MSEKLCIFCAKFAWSAMECWGQGSELTGPMLEGGEVICTAGHHGYNLTPRDERDWRVIIVKAQQCKDYEQVKA